MERNACRGSQLLQVADVSHLLSALDQLYDLFFRLLEAQLFGSQRLQRPEGQNNHEQNPSTRGTWLGPFIRASHANLGDCKQNENNV